MYITAAVDNFPVAFRAQCWNEGAAYLAYVSCESGRGFCHLAPDLYQGACDQGACDQMLPFAMTFSELVALLVS